MQDIVFNIFNRNNKREKYYQKLIIEKGNHVIALKYLHVWGLSFIIGFVLHQ